MFSKMVSKSLPLKIKISMRNHARQLISTTLSISFLIGLISLGSPKNVAMATTLNRVGILQFGILYPPKSGIGINLNDEEYRALIDEMLQHENKDHDPEEMAMRFPRRRETQQRQQEAIRGPKRFSFLDSARILSGRGFMIEKRFSRIGGNIMMGRRK